MLFNFLNIRNIIEFIRRTVKFMKQEDFLKGVECGRRFEALLIT